MLPLIACLSATILIQSAFSVAEYLKEDKPDIERKLK